MVAMGYVLKENYSWAEMEKFSDQKQFNVVDEKFSIGLDNLEAFINLPLDKKEAEMSKIDSKLVQDAKKNNYTDTHKEMLYVQQRARQEFDEYKDIYLKDLRQRSRETGRKIIEYHNVSKNNHGGTEEFHWYYLDDGGAIYSKKCVSSYKPKNKSQKEIEKKIKDIENHVCFYPKGFEDVNLMINKGIPKKNKENDRFSQISYLVGNIDKNTLIMYDVALNDFFDVGNEKSEETRGFQNVLMQASSSVYPYDAYYEYENQYAEDKKNGLYEYNPTHSNGYSWKEDRENWKSFELYRNLKSIHSVNITDYSDTETKSRNITKEYVRE